MFNENVMGYMLSNAYKKSRLKDSKDVTLKATLDEKEALQIFNEVVEVYRKHNVSYQCACKLTIALNEAFLSGAVELYNLESASNP